MAPRVSLAGNGLSQWARFALHANALSSCVASLCCWPRHRPAAARPSRGQTHSSVGEQDAMLSMLISRTHNNNCPDSV